VRLYRIPFSTNVERVALALAYKGLDAEPVEVDAADRSVVEHVSGQPLTPVLETDDGEVIADSTAILEWLEERHPDPPLYPSATAGRAATVLVVDWFNRVWKAPPNLIDAERKKPAPDAAAIAAWADELRGSRDRFEALLTGGEFLVGNVLSVLDVVAFPFLKYAALAPDPADTDTFHGVLHEYLAGDGHPRLHAWIARMDQLPRRPA
jgi:glutathione S-transferase